MLLNTHRRQYIVAAVGMAAGLSSRHALAQDYPNKPLRIIVPVPPGTGLDADARLWAAGISAVLGQPVLIDNRPGATLTIGTALAAKSAPDGYTLYMGVPSTLCYLQEFFRKLPYQASDFAAISQLTLLRGALVVNPSLGVKNLAELVALSKAQPDFLNVATQGVGGFQHLLGAWFASLSGARLNFIPYSTSSPYTSVLAGHTHMIFDALAASMPYVSDGKLKALAVSGATRHPLLPDVPTYKELGFPEFECSTWFGLLAPVETPKVYLDRVAAACAVVAQKPETIQRYRDFGGESVGSTPAEFSAYIMAERSKWIPVAKRSGIRLD